MLQRTDVAYMKIHFDMEEQFPEHITSEDEMDILAKHENAIEASTAFASRLIAPGTVHTSLMNRVTELQQTIDNFPTIQELADDYKHSQEAYNPQRPSHQTSHIWTRPEAHRTQSNWQTFS